MCVWNQIEKCTLKSDWKVHFERFIRPFGKLINWRFYEGFGLKSKGIFFTFWAKSDPTRTGPTRPEPARPTKKWPRKMTVFACVGRKKCDFLKWWWKSTDSCCKKAKIQPISMPCGQSSACVQFHTFVIPIRSISWALFNLIPSRSEGVMK